MLLSIVAHGALGFWDEVLYFMGALLFTAVVMVVWRVGRRFKPLLDQKHESPDQGDSSL